MQKSRKPIPGIIAPIPISHKLKQAKQSNVNREAADGAIMFLFIPMLPRRGSIGGYFFVKALLEFLKISCSG